MNNRLSKIIDLINNGNYLKAQIELTPFIKENPHSFDVNKLMAVSLLAQKKYNKAVPYFEKCYNIKEEDYDVLLNLSFVFLKVQHYEKCIEFANKAMLTDGTKPGSYQNLASSYFFLNKLDLAKEYANKSIELRGGFNSKYFLGVSDLVVLYADILIARKDHQEFVDYCLQTLELCYEDDLIIRLLRHDRTLISDKMLHAVQNVIKNSDKITSKVERHNFVSSAHFILAEYYSVTDKKKSEEHYIAANKYIADMQRQSIYNRQKICKSIIHLFKNFDTSAIVQKIDPKKGEGIIFILGMPRSGTTLTESIISTADDVIAGGEKSFFSVQLASDLKKLIENEPIDLSYEYFDSLGSRYLDQIKIQRGTKKFFTDKLPENYLYYKFIKLALPGAKFINCYRDPWDNAISLFKQNYSINIFYASSFFGIASEYANYKHIIQFWRELDGESFALDVDYETTVKDTNQIAKKIWDFCDLSGEFSEIKRKDHFGYTASMQQVTKAIYPTSLKKDDFAPQKDEFNEYLKSQEAYWGNV